MAEPKKCSDCGAALPPDAPGGHCVKCLLLLGLGADEAIMEPADPPERDLPVQKAGERIGRYKLLQQIGEGGCGVVYMAEQEEPVRRRVALKIIKLGMDTRLVIARFEAERQALALMDHPNIARVLDAGATETGRPYFVMELVRGIKITDYCDQQKFSTRQRLELFIQVCQAVQHAHQKGIIHRDLKPSNILVTERDGAAVPKIIDFGIAKATTDQRLTDKTLFTAFEQFIGTPAYMSPEQAGLGSLDVDTRSDIYSLGVLLYELLTGQPPFEVGELRRAALDEILRTIREKEPSRPSTRLTSLTRQELTTVAQHRQCEPAKLTTLFRGDLDWIVMKALEKDRSRRYETANGFAADLRRHLQNEAVLAQPPNNFYLLRKLVSRHRLMFLAIGCVTFALLLGLVSSTILFARESKARRHADLETRRAQSAEDDLKNKLWASYLAQAKADRAARQPGARSGGLDLLRQAAAIRPSIELRDEAIACMASFDLRRVQELDLGDPNATWGGFDAAYERYLFADSNGTLHVRDTKAGRELYQFPGYEPKFWALALSPNGRYLFAGYGKDQQFSELRDLEKNTIIFHHVEPCIRTINFSADSRFLAASYNLNDRAFPIQIYELSSGRELATIDHPSLPYFIQFSPTNPNLLLTSDDTATVRLWDRQKQSVIRTFSHPDGVQGICWSPDGNSVITACGDSLVRVWNLTAGDKPIVLRGHDAQAVNVVASADGKIIASSGWDGNLIFWDVHNRRELARLPTPGIAYEFSRAGRKLGVATGLGKVEIYDLAESTEYRALHAGLPDERTLNCAFSPNGKFLLTSHPSGLRLWDLASGKQMFRKEYQQGDTYVLFHPDGTNFFVASPEAVQKWSVMENGPQNDLSMELQQSWPLNRRGEGHFSLSSDGSSLATAVQGAIHVLSTVTGQDSMVTAGKRYERVALKADGRLLAAFPALAVPSQVIYKNVDIWDVAHTNLIKEISTEARAYSLFSPDQRWLAIGDETKYQVWDAHTWQLRYTLPKKERDYNYTIAISPDSAILAIINSEAQVRLLEMTSGRELATLEAPAPSAIGFLTFNADGTQLAAICASQAIQIWNLHQIRNQLATMKLDWPLPAYPPTESDSAKPRR